MRIAALALVGAIAVAVGLAGCTPAAAPTVTPTPRATPVFASDAEALKAAEKAYRAYEVAIDNALATLDDGQLSSTASGRALQAAKASVMKLKKSGQHDEGQSAVRDVRPADLSGLLTKRPSQGQIYACLDVSAVRVVDSVGTVVSGPSASAVFPMIVTLQLNTHRDLRVSEESVWNGSNFCD